VSATTPAVTIQASVRFIHPLLSYDDPTTVVAAIDDLLANETTRHRLYCHTVTKQVNASPRPHACALGENSSASRKQASSALSKQLRVVDIVDMKTAADRLE
jgi:hypothetical protein